MNLARCVVAGAWFVCAGVSAQPTEIDLSRYLDPPESDIERFDESTSLADTEQQPQAQIESPVPAPVVVEPAANLSPFFGMPQDTDPASEMEQQRLLLEQFGAVATLLREIKELGNEEAVLAMLEALSTDADTTELFRALFQTIKTTPVVQASFAAPVLAAVSQPVEPVRPRVVHPIVPVFAQVGGASGTTEKVVVSIDGTRFIRLPGETIEHEGRRIVVESLESTNSGGRDTISIWLIEDGRRFQLTW